MSQLTSGIQKDISESYNFSISESIMLKYHDLDCHLRCVSEASPRSRKASIYTIILSIIHIILHSNLIRIFFFLKIVQQNKPSACGQNNKSTKLSLGFTLGLKSQLQELWLLTAFHTFSSFPPRKTGCVTHPHGCISNPDALAIATHGTGNTRATRSKTGDA